MAQCDGISRRKRTGGHFKRPNRYRGKRRKEIARENQFAFVGDEDRRKGYRKHAGSMTIRVMQAHTVNVSDTKTGKTIRATISNVLQNDADPNYVRRNIVTKGAIVQTEAGEVRITSRPGMDGVISGVLLEN